MTFGGCGTDGPDAPGATPIAGALVAAPIPIPIPIKHVVVIVKENHTFDNYFGSFPGARGHADADGQNLCPTAGRWQAPCRDAPDAPKHDLCHEHECALTDWNGGEMNGWNAGRRQRHRRRPRVRAVRRDATSPTTGSTRGTSRSAITSSPTCSARASRAHVRPRGAGGLGDRQPAHGSAVQDRRRLPAEVPGPASVLGLRRVAAATRCRSWRAARRSRRCSRASTSPRFPTCCRAGTDWKFYGTNFDACSARSGRCSTP